MKKIYILLIIMAFYSTTAMAAGLTWLNQSKDYSAGDVIGGWEVLEYKDAVTNNYNGVWTISGVVGGDTRPNGASIMWFYYGNSSAQVTFSQKSTAVAFMVESDANDKFVNFYVDGVSVLSNYNMMTLPGQINFPDWQVGTLIVSGLSNDYHTIKIQSVDTADRRDDFHMYGGAAVAPVPVPSAVWLLGSGLFAIIGIRRKKI